MVPLRPEECHYYYFVNMFLATTLVHFESKDMTAPSAPNAAGKAIYVSLARVDDGGPVVWPPARSRSSITLRLRVPGRW